MNSKLEHNCETEFSSYSYTYEWKISNVSRRLNKSEPLQCPETIKSPPGKFPATEWRLEALGEKASNGFSENQQPNGWTVKLSLISQSEVWVYIEMQTKVNPPSYNTHKYHTRYLTVSPYCNSSHTIKITPRGQVTGFIPTDGDAINREYLYSQDLILCFKITVTQLESPVHATRTALVEKIKAPRFDLSMVLEDARQREQYTDVIIVTKEREFKAHKVVVASQSPFFVTRLEERWTEQGGNRINMTDVPADIMDAILTYMYTGKVSDVERTAYDLLPKAEEYQLEGLKITCEETLSKTLTAQNVIDVLLMADTHNAPQLKQSCLVFMAMNVTDVKKTSSWSEEKLNSGTNKKLWVEVLEFIVKAM